MSGSQTVIVFPPGLYLCQTRSHRIPTVVWTARDLFYIHWSPEPFGTRAIDYLLLIIMKSLRMPMTMPFNRRSFLEGNAESDTADQEPCNNLI